MTEIAKQVGIFIMAFFIVGIPFLNGLVADLKDEAAILSVFSAIDLFIVFLLINHCI